MRKLLSGAGALLLASTLCGQTPTELPRAIDGGFIKLTPLPSTPVAIPQGTLEMAALSGTVAPGDFWLVSAQSNRFGPYPYRPEAVIGSEKFPYTLRVDDVKTFRLIDPRKHAELGPFPYETGTTIAFAQTTLSVLRLPAQVTVSLSPRGKQYYEPTLALAPLTPATIQTLVKLRFSLSALYNRLSNELATRDISGMPLIRDAYGYNHNTIIKPSLRDREEACRRAEFTAGPMLEQFQKNGMPIKPRQTGTLSYIFPDVPPENYIFCALWRVQEHDALTVAPAAVEVWWTTFQIGPQEKITLSLNDKNACTWKGVFKFPAFE